MTSPDIKQLITKCVLYLIVIVIVENILECVPEINVFIDLECKPSVEAIQMAQTNHQMKYKFCILTAHNTPNAFVQIRVGYYNLFVKIIMEHKIITKFQHEIDV